MKQGLKQEKAAPALKSKFAAIKVKLCSKVWCELISLYRHIPKKMIILHPGFAFTNVVRYYAKFSILSVNSSELKSPTPPLGTFSGKVRGPGPSFLEI